MSRITLSDPRPAPPTNVDDLFTATGDTTEDVDADIYNDYTIYTTQVPGHKCSLPQAQDIICAHIYSGPFVTLRRRFRRFLMVDSANPESKAKLKSTASIREDEERHLQYFYYMIHPFSSGRTLWETTMIPVYIVCFFFMSLQVLFAGSTYLSIVVLEFMLFIPLSTDLVLWFYTGYFDEDKQVVVLNHRRVVRRYLMTYFVFDIIATLPVNSVYYVPWFKLDESASIWSLNLLIFARLPRIITLDKYIRKFGNRHKIGGSFMNAIVLALTLSILIHWATCILFYSKLSSRTRYRNNYITNALETVSKFMLVGLGSNPRKGKAVLLLELVYLIVGCILTKFITIKVMDIYSSRMSAEQEYWNLVRQMNEYMKYRLLPKHIKARVFQFINFKFQKHVYNEDLILSTLSKTLKREIVLHNCASLIEQVHFFEGIPLPIIARISSKLKSEIYLPEDVIIQAGGMGNMMYFIHLGTVAVFTSTGKEICHLNDGSHFGEISLVIKEPRTASVIAITECELFRLSRKDFKEAIAPYPDLATKIKKEAIIRMENTLRIMGLTEDEICRRRGQWLASDINLLGDEAK